MNDFGKELDAVFTEKVWRRNWDGPDRVVIYDNTHRFNESSQPKLSSDFRKEANKIISMVGTTYKDGDKGLRHVKELAKVAYGRGVGAISRLKEAIIKSFPDVDWKSESINTGIKIPFYGRLKRGEESNTISLIDYVVQKFIEKNMPAEGLGDPYN